MNTQTLAGYRAVIYGRVSTPDGISDRYLSVVKQQEACQEFVKKHGGEVVSTYDDCGPWPVRLGKRYRPQFEALLAAMVNGPFEVVVMYDRNQLWRSRKDRDSYNAVAEAAGITTVFVNENLTPPMRTALLNSHDMHPEDRLNGCDLSGTIVGLIHRGLVTPGGDGRHLPLTLQGIVARAELENES